jgi:glycine/D-amino acid oxidase-like deaminating enzyme
MVDRKAVVIGAGISGELVARELLRAGWQVEVLEARHVGAGSSSRTAAGIRQ